jgi:uncharacterized surface anchored protein
VPAEGESPSQSVTLEKLKEPQQCPRLTFVNEQKHDTCVTLRKTDDRGNPLAGWRLELTRNDGTFPPQSGLTDEKGEVTFNGLPLGDYIASETLQTGYLPGGPTSVPVSLTKPSPICQVITFENPPSTCIDGHKINHLETGLPGWEIKATHKQTGQMFTTTTDATGYFVFPALPLGIYLISETLQPGWTNITPTSFEVVAAEPRLPGQCYPVRFKNRYPYACLDVYKVDAYDGAGIPAWNMTLRPAYGGEAITLPTDGIGHVRFDKLTPGDYIVSEENKPGWFHVTEPRRDLSLAASGICEVITFENCQEINKDSEQCQR